MRAGALALLLVGLPMAGLPPTARADGAAPEVAWRASLADASIPDRPAAGTLGGQPFRVDQATWAQNLVLRHIEDGEVRAQVTFWWWYSRPGRLHHPPGRLAFHPTRVNLKHLSSPWVMVEWPGTRRTPRRYEVGYAALLDIGRAEGVTVDAGLYLCLPDDARSVIAGRLTIRADLSQAERAREGIPVLIRAHLRRQHGSALRRVLVDGVDVPRRDRLRERLRKGARPRPRVAIARVRVGLGDAALVPRSVKLTEDIPRASWVVERVDVAQPD